MSEQGVLYGVIPAVVLVVVYVWAAASLSAVFAKAGDQGWKAWVPILNLVVLLRLAGLSGWLVLLLLLPVLGWIAFLVVWIIACHRVTKAFGSGTGMTVLAVLLFPVWASILGWGSAHWLGTEHGGPVRRSTAPPLDARVAPPADVRIPVRPPAPLPPPAAGASIAAVAAGASPMHAAPIAAEPVPALPMAGRIPAPAPADDFDDTDLPRGRSHAPYTQTVPSSFTPPADAPPPPAQPRRAFAPQSAGSGGPAAPVQDVPPAPLASVGIDPWAPPLAAVGGAMRATRYSPAPDAEMQFETSAEVSAVAGAPTLGEPRSARESVSAQHGDAEVPTPEAAVDETIIAARRQPVWLLMPPLGAPIAVKSDTLIIGRRPGADPAFADAQLIPISDETRTMSKTHARLELQGGVWMIVDLDSTNGSILLGADGSETDIEPGAAHPATERFLLGDAELRLARKTDRE